MIKGRNILNNIKELVHKLGLLTAEINNHPLYNAIHTIQQLRYFMEQHVFAVWDFMCLLKELQRRIVSTSAPWFPPTDALSANLISSILIEEESDINEDGSYASHFDIYISAMKKIGADSSAIEKLLIVLKKCNNIKKALELLPIRTATKQFVLTTFSFFNQELHEIAAAFVFGREGITAAMFAPLVKQIKREIVEKNTKQFSTLLYYCKRHIELDDEAHFPKALQMLSNFVGNDEMKLYDVEVAATKALTARLDFLTDIQKSMPQ